MTGVGLVARLRELGHIVQMDGSEIVVRPRPAEAILDEMRACRGEIVACLEAVPAASDHRYVVWRGSVDRELSVCLACGKSPGLHGVGALDDPRIVDDPNEVILIEALAVVAVASAGTLAK